MSGSVPEDTPPYQGGEEGAQRRRLRFLLAGALLLLGAAVCCWFTWYRVASVKRDPLGATHANLRGVGLMDQFEYAAAASAFEEAIHLDPEWLPGRINLGIALLNTNEPANLQRALDLFQVIVKREPDNLQAHYCMGIIYLYQNQLAEAAQQFETVTRLDPNDAHAWLQRAFATPNKDESAEAKGFLRRALTLNPYLNAARYALAQHSFEHDDKLSKELLDEFQALAAANWQEAHQLAYTEMGRYAEVIGRDTVEKASVGPMPLFERDQSFRVTLAEGSRWAKAEDFENGVVGELRRRVRERFGAIMVRLDYNGDGRLDLLLLGAVVRGGKLGDLLLRNDGRGSFTDVTALAGLANGSASFGCSVADFDNCGRPDLLLTGPAGVRLFQNVDGAHFADVTATAGLDRVTGVCLGSSWIDLDQDGDLDLMIAQYAVSPEAALARLNGKPVDTGGEVLLFINIGEARPFAQGKPPGLTCRFKAATGSQALRMKGPIVAVAAVDLDADRDIDLLVLADGRAPAVVLNDRLLRFHLDPIELAGQEAWNGALVFDANHDEQSDLLLLPAGRKPLLLLSKTDTPARTLADRFIPGAVDAPPLLQAEAVDLDLDGWTDVVGLSQDGQPVYLQNDGAGRLVQRHGVLGPNGQPDPLLALAVCDLDGDGLADLLLWSAKDGLQCWRNLGNGNHSLRLDLTGRRDKGSSLQTNADALGARVAVYTPSGRCSIENTTLSAGLGQSRQPLQFGLGQAATADVVRIAWPDGVPQAELAAQAGRLLHISEISRKNSSCPILLTWNGSKFVFITDFLGAGSMGELAADGSTRPPRPEESIKIEPGQLELRDGRYCIKIAEPMDELLYLDWLQLDVIDHPRETEVYPDERFAVVPPDASQELLTFRRRILPKKAVDQRGSDVTALLRARDGLTIDQFARRSWIGFAEDHFLELDFGDQLLHLPQDDRMFLVLAGWTEYPYPESIYAAQQAGVPMITPLLSKLGKDGLWKNLGEIGFPAGLPRVMTSEVHGLAGEPACRLRIRSNLQIYWDQVFLVPVPANSRTRTERDIHVHRLQVERAVLSVRGFMREIASENRPSAYDDERTEPVAVTRWQGDFTKPGDVTKRLQGADDLFVICGPGGEITVEFDARRLPPVLGGYSRSFVLRTRGYCKDASPFTLTGGYVEPLPKHDMKTFPP
ncbi:MAG TPA: FG-GAP-like repeat-containing protein [Gemmataceae bacterium]|jgi:cytochrome c-type biogenesis protein CcmH/NrfG|nr:FG-GAP-like repeat-containing protein [Gemmataceae bacterium]